MKTTYFLEIHVEFIEVQYLLSTIYKLQCLSLRNGFPFQFHIFSRVQNFFGLLSVLQNVAKWKIVTKRKKKYTAFILKMGYRTNQIKSM